tara:strand:- start:2206 stop:2889 length:684 start_codon:yes stop_codon:yes gene_type:complete
MPVFYGKNMTSNSMRKAIAEFIGTFFLTLTIFLTALGGTAAEGFTDFAPVAIGLTLMVMVYAIGHISGAHFNPAVTIGLWLKGDAKTEDLQYYIPAQIIAGVAAWLIGSEIILDSLTITEFDPESAGIAAIVAAEALFTFALMYVIINVATEQGGNPFYGAAIGLTVMAGAFTVGSISMGSFNPAVTTMLLVSGKMAIADCWMHFIPQLAGAAAAVYAHKMTIIENE